MQAESLAMPPVRATNIIHPMAVRITHWINAVAMVIMIGSGWRIWNNDPIFDYYFPVWATLGGDPALSQDLHNELGLASALQWHFAGMWLLVINGLVYFTYGLLSGLAIWKPGQFQELAWLFGGFDTARLVHFLGMSAIVLFLIVHICLVIIVPKTLPTMITGRAPVHADAPHPM